MSKQLAISSAFSILAMAAFALFARAENSPMEHGEMGETLAGAPMQIEAPARLLQLPGLPVLPFFGD